jgi:hypothetical protein
VNLEVTRCPRPSVPNWDRLFHVGSSVRIKESYGDLLSILLNIDDSFVYSEGTDTEPAGISRSVSVPSL